MKFLFIVKVMLRDWMSVHRKYTLIIIITMILSVQALFFIATKNASENIESVFMERFCNAAYFIDPPPYDINNDDYNEYFELYPNGLIRCDRQFLQSYLDSGLPMPSLALQNSADLSAQAIVQVYGVNGVSLYEQFPDSHGLSFFSGLPAFTEGDRKFEAVLNMPSVKIELLSGRTFTEDDLNDHRHVIVAGIESGYKIGDVLDCGKYDFEVIGIVKIDSFEDAGLIPFWYIEECMSEYLGDRDIELEENVLSSIGGYDSYMQLTRMIYEKPLTSSQLSKLAELAHTSKSYIRMPYTNFLDKEYAAFYKATIAECAVFGLFCIANIILAVWSLCIKQIGTLRTFRVYGASNAAVTRLVVILIMCITLAAGVIGGALCIPMQKLYESINSNYAWRPYCMYIAVGALMIINLIAAIPTAILIVRKSPIGKEGN